MKKILSLILAVCMILSSLCVVSVYADEGIKIVVNGTELKLDQMPVIKDGRTLIPLRGISEALGAEVIYTDSTKRVTATRDDVVVKLKIGSNEAYVDEHKKTLDVPAEIINSRTMVPVRFVSEAFGSDVKWDDATRTVAITDNGTKKGNLAPLISEFHRPVPTKFEKSNKIDDILYFGQGGSIPDDSLGEIVYDQKTYTEGLEILGEGEYGTVEVKDGVLVATTTTVPDKNSKFIIKGKNQVKGEVKEDDVMLLSFDMRCTQGGDENDLGSVLIQLEEPAKYTKAIFAEVYAGREWETLYLPATGTAGAVNFGIRAGTRLQTVEIKNIKLINYGTGKVDFDSLSNNGSSMPCLDEGAQWREDAFKRIEEIRKGDFTVVVKDKEGNVIPDAKVELDMFEHEFQFGTSVRNAYFKNETAKNKLSENFNAGVSEGAMKWAPYMENETLRKQARTDLEDSKALGIKYYRGHTILWEVDGKTSAGNVMVPMAVQEAAKKGDKEFVMAELDKWTETILKEFNGELCDWDVVNEIVEQTGLRDTGVYGNEIYPYIFAKARDLDPSSDLYYNSNRVFKGTDRFMKYLEYFESNNVDYDGIGMQTHRNNYNDMFPMEHVVELYAKIREICDKKLKVTEFSNAITDINLQGGYTRDSLIAAFAEPNMEGFIFWGFWDGSNFDARSTFYDTEWNIKPAGLAYQDLVYNKWWTRDAKANTNAEGKAVINGFYGDYDVTVSANGKTVTKMVAFHKGYENILEFVVE